MNTKTVLRLDDAEAERPELAGRKAATLARLRRQGYPVPPGIVLTVHDAAAPDQVLNLVTSGIGNGSVAVRSSSPAEDGAEVSAAGRYLTVLDVAPVDPDLIDASRRVRESAGDAPMAVLIQPMVRAQAAGVAFSADPVTGDRDTVTISAVRGLADRVVDGSADADRWTVADGVASCRHSVEDAITGAQARQIAELATDVQRREGVPQDIEWAIDADGLHLLQARPITALPTAPVVDLPPGTWVSDRNRYPDGMTPFGYSLAAPEVSKGLTAAFNRCGSMLERVEMRGVAGRPYLQFAPVGGRSGTPPPAFVLGILARVIPALRRRCRQAAALLVSGELDADVRRWNATGRDQARHATDELVEVDIAALSDVALATHLERVREALRRGLEIHFRLIPAHLIGVYGLITACRDLLGWSDAEAVRMLSGISAASDEPTRELAALAAAVAADPAARRAVSVGASAAVAADGVDRQLRTAAPKLADRYAAWRRNYGLRTVSDDPGSPTLLEVPGLLDGLLLDQVRRAADAAGAAPREADAVAVGAERAVAAARAALADRPAAQRRRFAKALASARAAYPIREDNVLWAIAAPSGLARQAAVEVGHRLHRRGELDDPRDVVMLDVDAVLAGARGGAAPGALQAAVRRAKSERAWVAGHGLPEFYGPPPVPPPDLRHLPRAARFVNEALQLEAPKEKAGAPTGGAILLSGVAASPGRYRGPVRIVRTAADFASLRPGEILVCPITDPAWSVLFAVAGAIVADGGGVLSHAAIIAREHGIPAVLGTRTATHDLADGQIVTVDGSAATVLAADPTPEGAMP